MTILSNIFKFYIFTGGNTTKQLLENMYIDSATSPCIKQSVLSVSGHPFEIVE